MTITARDTIIAAMRLLRILETGQSPTGEEGEDGLASLNNLMRGFPTMGIDYAHDEIAEMADPLPVPDEQARAVQYMLAMELSSDYGATPSMAVMQGAEDGMRYLQMVYSLPMNAPADAGMLKR